MAKKHYSSPKTTIKKDHTYTAKKYTNAFGNYIVNDRGYCVICLADITTCNDCSVIQDNPTVCASCDRENDLCDYCLHDHEVLPANHEGIPHYTREQLKERVKYSKGINNLHPLKTTHPPPPMGRKHYRKPNRKPYKDHQYTVKEYTAYQGENTPNTRDFCDFCLADTTSCIYCYNYNGPPKICFFCNRQTDLCDYCNRGFRIITGRLDLIGKTPEEVAHWNQEFINAGYTSARKIREYWERQEYKEYVEERRGG